MVVAGVGVGGGGGGFGGGRGNGYRFNWDTPIVLSPNDPRTWYMGAQLLFKSTDKGSHWAKISPDLTLDIDRDTLKMMGAVVRTERPVAQRRPVELRLAHVDWRISHGRTGHLDRQRRRSGAAHARWWQDVDEHDGEVPGRAAADLREHRVPSRYKAGRVYVDIRRALHGRLQAVRLRKRRLRQHVAVAGSRVSPRHPSIASASIPRNSRVLVLGHERGAHFSNDGGATWIPLTTNLPHVPVDDIAFQQRDNALVLGTHGRGIWILDDATPLETLTADAMQQPAVLVPPHRAYLMNTFSPQAWYGEGERFSPNPEWDGVIEYHLRDAGTGRATIMVKNAAGATIRTLDGPVAKGVNRVVWDLRYAPPVDSTNVPVFAGRGGGGGGRGAPAGVTSIGFPAGGGGRGGPPTGPLVMPGRYAVSVQVPGIAAPLTGSITVAADPLPPFSNADRVARQATLMQIYNWEKALGGARAALRDLTGQRDAIKSDFGSAGGAQADSLSARITRLSGDVDRAFNAVNAQRGPIESWSGLPTRDQQSALGYALEDARKALTELRQLVGTDIPNAYRTVAKKAWEHPVSAPAIPAGGGT